MGGKWMGGVAVDSVQLPVKGCAHTPVHLIVPGIGEPFQRKAYRRKYAESFL